MSATTKIAWCDSTFNPWIGCSKVSPGCANCYAERDFDLRKHVAKWGAGQPRHRTSEAYWRQPLKWDRDAKKAFDFLVGVHGVGNTMDAWVRPRVFCASLADWLDDEVPIEWLADLLDLIRRTPHLDWLLLTKRPQLWRSRFEVIEGMASDANPVRKFVLDWLAGHAPTNVWIGTTVEDQRRADERIPALLKIPARVRFLSCEPLLGPVDITNIRDPKHHPDLIGKDALRGREIHEDDDNQWCEMNRIHWVIAGGESGPKARPMHPDWARSLRDQCAAAGVPFLFKQHGEWLAVNQMDTALADRLYHSNQKAKLHEDQSAIDECYGRTCAVPSCVVHLDGSCHDPIAPMAFLHDTGAMTTYRVGKHAAGRLLDGREHNEFPEVRP